MVLSNKEGFGFLGKGQRRKGRRFLQICCLPQNSDIFKVLFLNSLSSSTPSFINFFNRISPFLPFQSNFSFYFSAQIPPFFTLSIKLLFLLFFSNPSFFDLNHLFCAFEHIGHLLLKNKQNTFLKHSKFQ